MRPFRFGVSVWQAASRAEWIAKARKVEDLGYGTLLLPDHLAEVFSPFPPLVSAAEATRALRVGTFVLNNDLRHPVLVAREAATVDLLTDGRLELGIGAGHMKSEYNEAGIRFDPPAARIARLEESVAVIKGLLTGEPVTLSGRQYQVTSHRGYPRPAQRPRPPLLIGGNNRRILELAGREAEIAGLTGFGQTAAGEIKLSGFTTAATATRIDWLRRAAGARFDQIEINALIQAVTITDDRDAAARQASRGLPGLSIAEILDSPFLLIGTVNQIVEDLRLRRERFDISYYVVFEPAVDAFAPVVARLSET